ncbi:hypothetical protein J4479_01280 [Candidatus Woesearchaeota archaeon]|nr:hypothetical protein [Candidatus Woesearchaeota archaeon]
MDWDTPPGRRLEKEEAAKDKVENLDQGNLLRKNTAGRGVIIISVLLALVLISAFVIRPALIGYSVVRQVDNANISVSELGATLQELRTELASTKANLSLYSEVYDKVWTEVKTTTGDLTSCLSEKEGLTLEIETVKHEAELELVECRQQQTTAAEAVNRQLAEKDKKIAEAEQKLTDLKEDLDEFAFNLARSVCCKARVDNPNINSYEISNNRLVCLEDGEVALSC